MKYGKTPYYGSRVAQEGRKCPKCGKHYLDYPALSRKDNKTKICPKCGIREALNAFINNQL